MNRALELGQKDRWAVILAAGEGKRLRSYIHRIAGREFSQSVLAGHPDKFAVMPIADVEWSDLGVPERVIALRARENQGRKAIRGASLFCG